MPDFTPLQILLVVDIGDDVAKRALIPPYSF
jgi:hypothetical protein